MTIVAERGGYRNAGVLLSAYAPSKPTIAAAEVAGKLIGGGDEEHENVSGGEMTGAGVLQDPGSL